MKVQQSVCTPGAASAVALPRWITAIVWSFAMLFPLVAITQQSLWIDEGITANAVMQPTLRECWRSLAAVNGSDLQMPLYMAYTWAWEKVFGNSEFALRLANYPWFICAQVAGGFIWRDRRKGLLFIASAAASAFLWFYLNEARPYIMQYGGACLAVYVLSSFVRDDVVSQGKFWLLTLAITILAGANMLGALWVATIVAVATFLMQKKHWRPPLPPTVVCFGILGVLAIYYLWTLLGGARGATLPVRLYLNSLYLPYELGGFAGLGPGRLDIRTTGLSSFQLFALPLVVFALAWMVVIFRAIKIACLPAAKGEVLIVAFYAIPPLILLFLLGLFAHFNVLGRHAMPSLPFVFLITTLGLFSLWQDRRFSYRVVVGLFFVCSIASCLSIRFSPRHAKDDYRGAVAAVSRLASNNSVVWWCANRETALYYKLPVNDQPINSKPLVLAVTSPSKASIATLPPPSIVVLSKVDIYDSYGTVTAMLRQDGFAQRETLQAFSIWQRP